MKFKNRADAGQKLAQLLDHYSSCSNVIVLALPRGGVPVGYEVATHLKAPLEVFLVRKLGVPGHEEFAMGAIASGGIWFVNDEVVHQMGISRREIQTIVGRERLQLEERMKNYGDEFSGSNLHGKILIVVDDGLATGASMRVAVTALKLQHPEKIVAAVPVASASTCREFQLEVDELVCVQSPQDFYAVGQWYEDFSQTSDEEVRDLLSRARNELERDLQIPIPAWPGMF